MQGSFVSQVEEINRMVSWRIGPYVKMNCVGPWISAATASPCPRVVPGRGRRGAREVRLRGAQRFLGAGQGVVQADFSLHAAASRAWGKTLRKARKVSSMAARLTSRVMNTRRERLSSLGQAGSIAGG